MDAYGDPVFTTAIDNLFKKKKRKERNIVGILVVKCLHCIVLELNSNVLYQSSGEEKEVVVLGSLLKRET